MALTKIQSYVLKQLNKGHEMDGTFIKMLIDDFTPIATQKKALYDRYTNVDVPILKRNLGEGKINNRVNNDFVGEIIDTKVSYILGNPIHYSLDKNNYKEMEDKFKKHQGHINQFIVRNSMNDLDIELGKLVSICGVAGREIYIDKNGNERIANLRGWETIFLTNAHDEVEYAIRFYTELRLQGEELVDVIVADVYDSEKITHFIESVDETGTMTFILDDEVPVNPQPHVFGFTPIIKVVNNEEEMGDVEPVLALVDGYDKTMSDINSEIEQFRLAYMYFKGDTEPDKEIFDKAKQTGGFYVGKDGEIGFITKNINDAVVEHHLDRIENNIQRFAKHVRLDDPSLFGNNASGDAIKTKILTLENKTKMLEVKMKTSLFRQFEILSSAWLKKGIDIDYLNLFFNFKRNLPSNLSVEADIQTKLNGLISDRTRLAELSFVDDVDYELEQMAEDQERKGQSISQETALEDRVNLDSIEDEEV